MLNRSLVIRHVKESSESVRRVFGIKLSQLLKSAPAIFLDIGTGLGENSDEVAEVEIRAAWQEHSGDVKDDLIRRCEELEALRTLASNSTNPVERQSLLLKCRQEQRSVTMACKNAGDASKKLDLASNVEMRAILSTSEAPQICVGV